MLQLPLCPFLQLLWIIRYFRNSKCLFLPLWLCLNYSLPPTQHQSYLSKPHSFLEDPEQTLFFLHKSFPNPLLRITISLLCICRTFCLEPYNGMYHSLLYTSMCSLYICLLCCAASRTRETRSYSWLKILELGSPLRCLLNWTDNYMSLSSRMQTYSTLKSK